MLARLLLVAVLPACSLLLDLDGPVRVVVVIDGGVVDELCNDRDDDGDERIDEGAGQLCYPFAAGEPGVGACVAGVAACEDGELAVCVGATGPSDEVDNRVDDDCDGAVDEDQ